MGTPRTTVASLRKIAERLLGSGAARLRTRKQLQEAIAKARRGASRSGGRGKGAAPRAGSGRAAKGGRKARAGGGSARRAAAGAEKARPPRRTARAGARAAPRAGAGSKRAARKARPATPVVATGPMAGEGLDPEGYFIARVRGEEAVRQAPHPMTEGEQEEAERRHGLPAPPAPAEEEEDIGDLPWKYGGDAFVALPRDPRTLFFYWDHADETLARAFDGLDQPRTEMWVFARDAAGGWDRVRVVGFALESHGYYVHDLEPGRTYRGEIHAVDRAGRDRLVARPSNPVQLPPSGPSPVVDDRYARIPWDLPLQRWLKELRAGEAFPEDLRAQLARLSDWSRFQAEGAGSGAGGVGGRPSSPGGAWGSGSGGGRGGT